jgi:hypothetical protein
MSVLGQKVTRVVQLGISSWAKMQTHKECLRARYGIAGGIPAPSSPAPRMADQRWIHEVCKVSQLVLISSSNMRACDTNRAGTTAVTM